MPLVVGLSSLTHNNYINTSATLTLKQLIGYGFKLDSEVQVQELDTVKMTVAEISKLVGKKVEVIE